MQLITKRFKRFIELAQWVKFSTISAILAWCFSAAILFPISLYAERSPYNRTHESAGDIIFGGLIVAPLIENILTVGALTLLRNKFSIISSTGIVALIAAAIHAIFVSWGAIAALALFSTMGLSYLSWQASRPKFAFLVIFVQHALFNLPMTIAGTLEVLGR